MTSLSLRSNQQTGRGFRTIAKPESFYAELVDGIEVKKYKTAIQPETKRSAYAKAKAWWDDIFMEEMKLARKELAKKNINLDIYRPLSRDLPEEGFLKRGVIFEQRGMRSPPFIVLVQDGTISFRQLIGDRLTLIDGYMSSLDLRKSSAAQARLMITKIITECL